MIAIAIAIAIVAVVLFALFLWKIPATNSSNAWEIVCNDDGEFSFRNWDGRVYELSYQSRGEAVKAMFERKQWSDDYDAGKTRQQRREKSFHKC